MSVIRFRAVLATAVIAGVLAIWPAVTLADAGHNHGVAPEPGMPVDLPAAPGGNVAPSTPDAAGAQTTPPPVNATPPVGAQPAMPAGAQNVPTGGNVPAAAATSTPKPPAAKPVATGGGTNNAAAAAATAKPAKVAAAAMTSTGGGQARMAPRNAAMNPATGLPYTGTPSLLWIAVIAFGVVAFGKVMYGSARRHERAQQLHRFAWRALPGLVKEPVVLPAVDYTDAQRFQWHAR